MPRLYGIAIWKIQFRETVMWGLLKENRVEKSRVVNGWSEGWEEVVRKNSCSCFPSGFSSSAVGNVLAYHRDCCWRMEWFLMNQSSTHTQTHTHTSDMTLHKADFIYYIFHRSQIDSVEHKNPNNDNDWIFCVAINYFHGVSTNNLLNS